MSISLIAAMDKNRLIGCEGKIPWHLPEDLKLFKALTLNKSVIMGRKTCQSLPKVPLPQRRNIVVTSNPNFEAEGCEIVFSLSEAFERTREDCEVMVIGGGKIYEQALDDADTLYLTIVQHSFEGDTYFPDWDDSVWELLRCTYYPQNESNIYAFNALTLKRSKSSRRSAISSPPQM